MILLLEFTAFNVEAHSTSCRYDNLTITDGDGTILMENACGASLPADIRSRSNVVDLLFRTDRSGTRAGWSLIWRTVTPG